jgi:superfamily I DNA and/or RNA helicase
MSITEALTAAAFLNRDGQFIAVGDHRQMPPILAHTWDQDNRRDLRRARPHLSIFEYLIKLGFPRAALDESFRIPAEIADFLDRHVYASDGINYRSQNRRRLVAVGEVDQWIAAALTPEHPMILIEHDEEGSQQANEFEASVIEALVQVAATKLQLDAENGIGVVVPHRAQKALLASRLPDLAQAIDTVERFQGGERELIIVSATVSDREYAQSESEFLLDPRRLTVAVSRPKRKLIVVAARTVFDLIPSDLDEYERGSLWKKLRRECAGKLIWEGKIGMHQSRIFAMVDYPNSMLTVR